MRELLARVAGGVAFHNASVGQLLDDGSYSAGRAIVHDGAIVVCVR